MLGAEMLLKTARQQLADNERRLEERLALLG
jgi:hypothetical protein